MKSALRRNLDPVVEPSESSLIKQVSAGIYALLLGRTNDQELARDLLQETLEIILVRYRAGEIRDLSSIYAFARSVAIRRISAHFRRTRERLLADEQTPPPELKCEKSDPERNLIAWDRLQLVLHAIASLRTPRDQEVLSRFYVELQSKDTICSAMSLAPADFDRVLSRAKQRLRKQLPEEEPPDDEGK